MLTIIIIAVIIGIVYTIWMMNKHKAEPHKPSVRGTIYLGWFVIFVVTLIILWLKYPGDVVATFD